MSSDDPPSFSDEVYDESRYTSEARKIIKEWAARSEPQPNGRDLIVVVPPGTRVRYVENPYTDGKVYALDAAMLEESKRILSPVDMFTAMPVYDAEEYQRDV